MRAGNGIDLISLLNRNAPNSFFEKFEMKETSNKKYEITAYLCTLDIFNKNTGKATWSHDIYTSAYHSVNLYCLTDETYFNFLNNKNFHESLRSSRTFKHIKTGVLDWLGEKTLDKQTVLFETDEEIVYNLFYKFKFTVPADTGFVGFITHVSCDKIEYANQKKLLAGFDLSFLNDSFVIEKFALIKNYSANNIISRPFTKQDLLWCGEYLNVKDKKWEEQFSPQNNASHIHKGIDFYYVNDIKYPITFKDVLLPVIVYRQNSPITTFEINSPPEELAPEHNYRDSLISDVYTSIDPNNNLQIMFSMNLAEFILRNSTYVRLMGMDRIENNTIEARGWNFEDLYLSTDDAIEQCTPFTYKLFRIDKKGNKSPIPNKTSDFANVWISDKSLDTRRYLNNIKMFKFSDAVVNSFLPDLNYTYKFEIEVQDGFMKNIATTINRSREPLKFVQEYLNYCRSIVNKVNEFGTKIYYNDLTDTFTEKFIEDSTTRSYYSKAQNGITYYTALYALFKGKYFDPKDIQVLLSNINPSTASISSIENFYEIFKNSIKICENFFTQNKLYYKLEIDILDYKTKKSNWFLDYTGRSINNFNPKLKDLWGWQPPTDIIKVDFSTEKSLDLKSQEKLLTDNPNLTNLEVNLLFEFLSDKDSNEIKITNVYEFMSKYVDHMRKINEQPLSSIFSEALNRLSMHELINMYQYLSGRTINTNSWATEDWNSSAGTGILTKDDFVGEGRYSVVRYLNAVVNYLSSLEQITDNNPDLVGDIEKFMFIIFRYLTPARVQFFQGYFRDIKNDVWRNLDAWSFDIFRELISANDVLIRFNPESYEKFGLFKDEKMNLDMMNQYIILKSRIVDTKDVPAALQYFPEDSFYPIEIVLEEEVVYVAPGNVVHTYVDDTPRDGAGADTSSDLSSGTQEPASGYGESGATYYNTEDMLQYGAVGAWANPDGAPGWNENQGLSRTRDPSQGGLPGPSMGNTTQVDFGSGATRSSQKIMDMYSPSYSNTDYNLSRIYDAHIKNNNSPLYSEEHGGIVTIDSIRNY